MQKSARARIGNGLSISLSFFGSLYLFLKQEVVILNYEAHVHARAMWSATSSKAEAPIRAFGPEEWE